ncbi:unnamed protein product, partial [Mesorhabditis spiculigera]
MDAVANTTLVTKDVKKSKSGKSKKAPKMLAGGQDFADIDYMPDCFTLLSDWEASSSSDYSFGSDVEADDL